MFLKIEISIMRDIRQYIPNYKFRFLHLDIPPYNFIVLHIDQMLCDIIHETQTHAVLAVLQLYSIRGPIYLTDML